MSSPPADEAVVTVGVLQTGSNVIPDEAIIKLDVRTPRHSREFTPLAYPLNVNDENEDPRVAEVLRNYLSPKPGKAHRPGAETASSEEKRAR